MRKVLSRAVGFLLAVSLALLLLTMLIDGMGTSPALMLRLMERNAPPEATGLAAEHYPGVVNMITGYLGGRVKEFQYTWTDAGGVSYLAFRDSEQQHMKDCFGLFVLCRGVALASLAAVCLMLGAAFFLRDWRRMAGGFLAGGLLVLGAVAVLGVWGLVDFDGLFVLFHRLSFDNGLWLMDPRTDLLIRLMPIDFFIQYAALLIFSWLAGMLLMLLLARRVMKHRPQTR